MYDDGFLVFRRLVNADCNEKRAYMCMSKALLQSHDMECPKSFIKYKNDCYYHSYARGDYNTSELLCAEKSSKAAIDILTDLYFYIFLIIL